MNTAGRSLGAIAAAGVWITLVEFVRNEVLLKSMWIDYYASLGMTFPSDTVNNVIWVLWSFCIAAVLYLISRRFTLVKTFLLGWFVGFILMWLVIGNMHVLPMGILPYAIPVSIVEAFVAAYLVVKIDAPSRNEIRDGA